MRVRTEFNGMLPAAIDKFESLLTAVPTANVVSGYNSSAGKDSFFYWGCAARITDSNMTTLRSEAENLGITWLSDDGDMAYVNNLSIADFKTYRVNGNLELIPEEEEV